MSDITEGPPLSLNDDVAQCVDAAKLTGADHFMTTQKYATYSDILHLIVRPVRTDQHFLCFCSQFKLNDSQKPAPAPGSVHLPLRHLLTPVGTLPVLVKQARGGDTLTTATSTMRAAKGKMAETHAEVPA